VQAKQNKEFIHYILWAGRCSAISRAPSGITVTWEDKRHHSERPPLPSISPQLYMLSMTPYGTEYNFGQWGSAVPAVSPSRAPPSYSLVGWGKKKTPWLCVSTAQQ